MLNLSQQLFYCSSRNNNSQMMKKKPEKQFGVYTTKAERDYLGKDLRQAHFNVGTAPSGDNTIYKIDYVAYKFGDPSAKKDNPVGEGLLRRTNFIMGLDKDKNSSSYKIDYGPKNAENVTLRDDILKDLRATHYNLGTDPMNYTSIQKQDYPYPTAQKGDDKNMEAMKSKMRTHNFKFGDDPSKYQTSSGATFKPQKMPLPTTENNGIDGKEFRKAHFVFGSDPNSYATTKAMQFPGFPIEESQPMQRSASNAILKKSSIPFNNTSYPENKADKFSSIASSTFRGFPIEKKGDTKAQAQYLRSSHFNFGNDPSATGIPISKSDFIMQEFAPTRINDKVAADIRGSHIHYLFNPNHDGNAKVMGQTTYRDQISENSKRFKPTTELQYKDLHKTNFPLGFDPSQYITEASSKYYKPEIEDNKKDLNSYIERMRKPNFDYQHTSSKEDPINRFSTENRDRYTEKPYQGNEKERSNTLKKYCSQAHFKLGDQPPSMLSTKEMFHSPQGDSKRGLNQDQLSDLRKEHFQIGSLHMEYLTQYQHSHGKWIQPVTSAELT